MKRICGFLLILLLFVILVPTHNSQASVMSSKLKGRILLQVDSNGESWYINPVNEYRYYLGQGEDALNLMKGLGVGISNADLAKIRPNVDVISVGQTDSDVDGLPDILEQALGTDFNKADTDGDSYSDYAEVKGGYNPLGSGVLNFDSALTTRFLGRILLQVQSNGEAWYVNPVDRQRYYLGRGEDAFALMRALGLGISNDNLGQIKKSTPLTVGYIRTGSLYYKGEFLKPRHYEMENYCYNSDALNNQAIPAFKGNHLKKYSLFNGDNLTFGDVDCNCVDGACLENTCYDSDGGKDTGVKGETFGDYSGNLYDRFVVNFVVNKDECINSKQLTEFYCINNTQSGSETVDCPCLDGECVGVDLSSTKCYDSDGGNNPYSRGETYGNYNGDVYDHFVVHKDQCANKNQLNEYYCIDDKQSTGTGVSCECLDGACVK